MPEDKTPDDPMFLILAEPKSINRTLRLLAGHLMDHEAPPRPAVDEIIPFMSDQLPQRLAEPFVRRLRYPVEESICWVNYGELGAAPEEFFPTKLRTDQAQIGADRPCRMVWKLDRLSRPLKDVLHMERSALADGGDYR